MADIKISELTAVSSLNNGDLVEVSQVNALAPSGYTSLKASMTDLGKKVNADIEYTTDLADFEDKTALGAIKETAKDKNVADEYDDTQTYDKGDVVICKNTLYICNTNNTTGTWDATKWTATTVQSLIGSLSQLTTTDKSSLVGAVNEVNKHETDTYNISTYGGTIICQKWGRVVNIQGANIGTVQSLPTGASHVLASISSKYCPANSLRVVGMANAGSYQATTNSQSYAISSDGRITTYAYASPSIANGVFNITYLV